MSHNKLYIVGLGPGNRENMTYAAYEAMKQADAIVGYTKYLELVPEELRNNSEMISTGMRAEAERCQTALKIASEGKCVALICSGDGVVYGMAGLVYELSPEYPAVDIEVIPGVTAALSGSALIGAGVGHDFSVISLSDYLTPKELINKRLVAAASTDMIIVLYNTVSKSRPDCLKEAVEILKDFVPDDRLCAVASNIGRQGENYQITTLNKLCEAEVDMFSTIFIGSSRTVNIDGKFVTKRGYKI